MADTIEQRGEVALSVGENKDLLSRTMGASNTFEPNNLSQTIDLSFVLNNGCNQYI